MLEGLKLKLQYFGLLIQRANSLEKTEMLGKIEGSSEKGTAEDKVVRWHTDSVDMSLLKLVNSEGQGSLVCCNPWESESQTRLSS